MMLEYVYSDMAQHAIDTDGEPTDSTALRCQQCGEETPGTPFVPFVVFGSRHHPITTRWLAVHIA
jgi:hypothetical protein